MVKYLIDTDILIYFLKNKPDVVGLLGKLKWENCGLSAITVAEVLEGIEDKKLDLMYEWLEKITIIDCGFKISKIFGQQRKIMRKAGNLIDNMDLLVASTAIAYNLTLVTNNLKHFQRVKGLEIYGSDF